MTQTIIQEQIKTIQKATRNASRSKESATQFLKDAGIIKNVKSSPAKTSSASKKK